MNRRIKHDAPARIEEYALLGDMRTAALVDRNGNDAEVAPGSGHIVRIPLPDGVNAAALNEFAMLVRYLPREIPEARSA